MIRPIFFFASYYPLPIVFAQLSILFRCSSATLSTIFRSIFLSSLSPSSSQFFLSIFLSFHRSFLSLVRSLLVPLPMYPLATYLPDYLVLDTGYSVLGTRYQVYSPTTTIGEHIAAERRHPEATAFVPFVLARLLLLLPAGGSFVSVSRRRNAWSQDTPRAHALYLLSLFLLFLFLLLFLTSSASSPSSCYRLLVVSLRESSSSHLSIRLLFEEQVRKRTCLFVRMTWWSFVLLSKLFRITVGDADTFSCRSWCTSRSRVIICICNFSFTWKFSSCTSYSN